VDFPSHALAERLVDELWRAMGVAAEFTRDDACGECVLSSDSTAPAPREAVRMSCAICSGVMREI